MKLSWEIADSVTKSKHDCLAAFVYLSTRVIERIHRNIRENKQILFRNESREHVLKQSGKVMEIELGVGKEKKFCERQLSLAQNTKPGDHRLTPIALTDHCRAQ